MTFEQGMLHMTHYSTISSTARKVSCAFVAIACVCLTTAANAVTRDAEIESYLKKWSRPIFQAAGLYSDNVEMLIEVDKSINAFVAGGQNIFISTGLMQKAENPEQFMTVIGHETGHIAAGHRVSREAEQSIAQLKALAATIVGIGAAVATGDSTAGVLGAAGGAEIAGRSMAGFTRGQESAADQLGAQYMRALGVPPEPNMFRILEKEQKYFGGGDHYLSTHPVNSDRISAMRSIESQSPYRGQKLPASFQDEFKRMQSKIDGFVDTYREVLQKYPENDQSIYARYARAISVYLRGELRRALPLMDDLIRSEPSNSYFHELKGQALLENGYLPEAAFAYEQAISLQPGEPLFRHGIGQAYIEQNDRANIEKGLQHVNAGLAEDREDPTLWRLAATGYGKLQQLGWSALCQAEYDLLLGRSGDAIRSSKRAMASLQKGTPGWQRAKDLRSAAEQSRNR